MRLNALDIENDLFRRFDPRARVIAAAALILIIIDVSNLILLAVVTAVCILLLCRDFLRVVKRIIPLELFCALFLAQSFFGLIEFRMALVYILRVHCAALIYMLVVIPAGIGALAQALGAFRVQPKLISILYLTHRYIFLMRDKIFCSINAMRRRKNPVNNGVVFLWKAYAAVFAASIAASFSKAESVTKALASRGFDGVIPRTRVQKWRVCDTLFVITPLAGLALFLFYRFSSA